MDGMFNWLRRNKPGGIFLSYRREEMAQAAGRLSEHLRRRFGDNRIFIDVDSISLGLDFVEVITSKVASCDVLIALIGSKWLTAVDEEGRRRLDDEQDYVRLEIEAALQRNIRVVPILIDGARMPRTEDLPLSLHALTRRQALKLSHEDFTAQANRLIENLAPVLPWSVASSTPTVAPGEPEKQQPNIEVLEASYTRISLALLLDAVHRIVIDAQGAGKVDFWLDGKQIKSNFVIVDGDRRIPASILVKTDTWMGGLEKVVLVIDGSVVYRY
jgi:TIR domain